MSLRLLTSRFNYCEFAMIKSNIGLNSYKINVKEWVLKKCNSKKSLKKDKIYAIIKA